MDKILHSAWLAFLVPLIGSAAAWLGLLQVTPTGTWVVQQTTASALIALVLFVVSSLGIRVFQFWYHDRKRTRIKEAHDMGRTICPCSEIGEIMIRESVRESLAGHPLDTIILRCPRCGNSDPLGVLQPKLPAA